MCCSGREGGDSVTDEKAFFCTMRDDRNSPEGKRREGVCRQSRQQKENYRGKKVGDTFGEQWEA